MKHVQKFLCFFAFAFALALSACGDDGNTSTYSVGSGTTAPTPISVDLHLQSATLTTGDTLLLSARVNRGALIWQSNGGELTPDSEEGNTATFTAQEPGVYTITVTSTKDSKQSAAVTLTVIAPPIDPPYIAINPITATLHAGDTLNLFAAVNKGAITWQTDGGELTPDSEEGNTATFSADTPNTYTLTAVSTEDATQKVSATITVLPNLYAVSAAPNALSKGVATSVIFAFQRNGVALPNTPVTFTANADVGLLEETQTTNANGLITLNLTAANAGNYPVTATVNGATVSATLTVTQPAAPDGLFLTVAYNRPSFVTADFSATATITATATDNGSPVTINVGDVTWTVVSSSITAPWWGYHGNRDAGATNGLTWGSTPIALSGSAADAQRTDMNGNGNEATKPTGDTALLTDIIGSREVVVQATITINSTVYTKSITVTFGEGPLSVFAGAALGQNGWASAVSACGGTGDMNIGGYQPSTKLPSSEQLQNIAGPGSGGKQGAAIAAGWTAGGFYYWSGVAYGDGNSVRSVSLGSGSIGWSTAGFYLTVCLP